MGMACPTALSDTATTIGTGITVASGLIGKGGAAGFIFSAAGRANADLWRCASHQIGTADAFVIIRTVIRTTLVRRLQRGTRTRKVISVFPAGFIIVAFA